MVETPAGIGRFVEHIPHRGIVVVEMDNTYLVEFKAEEVYILEESIRN